MIDWMIDDAKLRFYQNFNSLIGFDFRFARRFSIPFGRRPLVLQFVIKRVGMFSSIINIL